MNIVWPLSKTLLNLILADRISDQLVEILVWERLGYHSSKNISNTWVAGTGTPIYWSEKFPNAPEIISERPASVHLTRSIPKAYKQSLKKILSFEGYRIGELYPRKTRRATAVNWLLSWSLQNGLELVDDGPIPSLSDFVQSDDTKKH